MAKQQLTDFTLPTDAYASFDAVSLKALIKERLNDKSFFTDQNFDLALSEYTRKRSKSR